MYFKVQISATPKDGPSGYLFLCPRSDFHVGKSVFGWPDCAAYWSRDPLGLERLSTNEAMRFGFPSIKLKRSVYIRSWDADVYAGLRQFHQGKGFNPDSQDIARHLGHPLFQVSSQTLVDRLFAHGESTIFFYSSDLS
jgi:hypothetical protein